MLADASPDAHAGNRFGQRGKALNRLPMVFHKFRIVPLECFAVKDPIKLVSECFLQFLPIIFRQISSAMLEQERLVQIALYAFAVRHNVPAFFQLLCLAFVCLMIILACFYRRVYLFDTFQIQ